MTYKDSKEILDSYLTKIERKTIKPRTSRVPRWTMTAILAAGLSLSVTACDDDDDDDPGCPNCDYAAAFHEENIEEKTQPDPSNLPNINDEPQDDENPQNM